MQGPNERSDSGNGDLSGQESVDEKKVELEITGGDGAAENSDSTAGPSNAEVDLSGSEEMKEDTTNGIIDEEFANASDGDEAETAVSEPEVGPIEEVLPDDAADEDIESQMDWYILKVQSNREKSICDGLRRRVSVAGLERYFGDVIVPTEDVAEFKNGRRRVVKRKLYPGYIVVHMAINDETWFLVRETPGIGDFTGSAGRPTPMLSHEVERIVKSAKADDEDSETIKTAIPFKEGDRVRIKEGTFENFEGDVEGIDEANGRVTVMINIFGRSTPVELEHWQVDEV